MVELPPMLEEELEISQEPEPTIADLLTPKQPKPEPEAVIVLKSKD